MGCASSKSATAATTTSSKSPSSPGKRPSMDDGDTFYDASEALLALPSFMRAKSLERLKSVDIQPMKRATSVKRAKAPETIPEEGMSRCIVPLFEKGLTTLADEKSDASWSENPEGKGFVLRGKHYKKDKKKVPSLAPFYDVKGVLAFKSDEKVGDWIKNLFSDDLGVKIKGELPSVLIVNIMVPDYKPTGSLFAKKENDGPGHNVVLLCKMSDFARKMFEETEDWNTLPEDYRLLIRYLKGDGTGRVDTHPHELAVRQQTKMVVMVVTGHEHLPWIVRQAVNHGNGKPFMVNRTSSYIERSGALELNVDAHNFSNVALNGLRTVHSSLGKLILDVGATVQGENEDELPERLLFSCRINYAKIELIDAHVDMLEAHPTDRDWLPPVKAALA